MQQAQSEQPHQVVADIVQQPGREIPNQDNVSPPPALNTAFIRPPVGQREPVGVEDPQVEIKHEDDQEDAERKKDFLNNTINTYPHCCKCSTTDRKRSSIHPCKN